MILEENLKDLHVAIRGGGNIVSHRPVFTRDSRYLLLVSSDTVQIFNTDSGESVAQIQTPSSSRIANIILSSSPVKPEDALLVLTESGELIHFCLDSFEILKVENLNLSIPRDWTSIRRWLNILELKPGSLLLVGHPENSEEVMLYEATRDYESKKGKYRLEKICWQILPTTHAVSVGCRGELVAAAQPDSVFMTDMTSRVSRWHKSGTRKFTCVAAHPHDWIVATGDDSGRILVWKNFLEEKSPAKAVFHWHTLPVADLCFTTDGSQFLSGGNECCLVRWDVNEAMDRKILPRMGLPIRHICVSYGNLLVAVSHADNCIQLVGEDNKVVRVIQNITQCYIPEDSTDENTTSSSLGGSSVFQAGLQIDPNTKSLVMNGKPGHLQCYSLREDKHLYTLDITHQNYITAERKRIIPNADVTHICFSSQGKWLATVESLTEGTTYYELRLKFWKFDTATQTFLLNTSINWPHEQGIVNVRIHPGNDEDQDLIAATSGRDKTFKTWGVVHDQSMHGKSDWWNCENIGSYRDLETGPLAFSQDGSVLAVPFGNTLTLWKTEDHELSGTLCHSRLKGEIKLVEFSTHPTSHLVICCSKSSLVVWDVITLSLMWTVPFSAESLAVDSFSNLVAVFSEKQHLYFFKPEVPEPIAVHKNVSRSSIVSSVFVPTHSTYEFNGLKSLLVFINSSQELCAMLPKKLAKIERSGTKSLKIEQGISTLTPFAKLIAEKRVSAVRPTHQSLQGSVAGIPGAQVIREIMDASPHTAPSVTYFCNKFLSAITVEKKESETIDYIVDSLEPTPKIRSTLESNESDRESYLDFRSKKSARKGSRKRKASLEKDESKGKTVPSIKLDLDLDEVANEDISWIRAIYE